MIMMTIIIIIIIIIIIQRDIVSLNCKQGTSAHLSVGTQSYGTKHFADICQMGTQIRPPLPLK